MHKQRWTLIAYAVMFVGLTAQTWAQDSGVVDATAGAPEGEEYPWPTRLGVRSLQLTDAFALVDQVVLVPDEATYIDEISRWSPRGVWPVLIEDDRYAPMFVRGFGPAKVFRRDSIGALPDDGAVLRERVERAVVAAFGGDPNLLTMNGVHAEQGWTPPGVVIASTDDPAWTAALALAAGRGQPIAWLDGDYGRPNGELDDAGSRALMRAVTACVEAQGLPYAALGDAIETITICRSMAGRSAIELPASSRRLGEGTHHEGLLATTDLLGRDERFDRYAFAGWIFGDSRRAAYMAMCSMFLRREHATLVNTYPSDGEFAAYDIDEASTIMGEEGFRLTTVRSARASQTGWLRLLRRGFDADVLIMNSRGSAHYFDVSNGRCYPNDVPVLNRPLALHLIHSWSIRAPANRHTVGGRWLDHGVYAIVGSMQEPYLAAFAPPTALADRWRGFVPFLVSARHWVGQGSHPWRINTIGDPLMVCVSPVRYMKAREAPNAAREGLDTDLIDLAGTAMRQAAAEGLAEGFEEAAHTLMLLGRDDLIRKLWPIAAQKGQTSAMARPALGAFFRSGDATQFLEAWSELRIRDEEASDMLWHLMVPRLGESVGHDELLQLQSAIRRPMPHVDIERLAPYLTDAFGRSHVTGLIDREIDRTTNESDLQQLMDLRDKI